MMQMKTYKARVPLAAALAALVAAPLLPAQDMVKVAPKNCTVLLDKDRVRIIRS